MRPLIIDVDTGTDDAICIIFSVIHQEKFDIRCFTTVCGNVCVEKTSQNTLDILEYLNSDYPVAIGADKPIKGETIFAKSHGHTGLGDIELKHSEKSFAEKKAYEVIIEEAKKQSGNLEILAVGPLTNIALALKNCDDLHLLIKKITIMGGGIFGGNMTIGSEFNLYNDADAAAIVFTSGIKIDMVGLDVTLKPELPNDVYEKASKIDNDYGRLVYKILTFIKYRSVLCGGDKPNLHDVIALAYILKPKLFKSSKYYIEIETKGTITKGMTVVDYNCVAQKEPNVNAVMDIDIKGFWTWFLNSLKNVSEMGGE